MTVQILTGDCRDLLATLPDASVQCCVTSPPYHGLRDYKTARWEGGDPECDHVEMAVGMSSKNTLGHNGHLPETNAANVGRVRQYRGTCGKCGAVRIDKGIGLEPTIDEHIAALVEVFREVRRVLHPTGTVWLNYGDAYASSGGIHVSGSYDGGVGRHMNGVERFSDRSIGLKPKDLIGLPWRLAFALQQPYNVPTCVKSEIDRAWLAAMFDGEGCIGIRRHDSNRRAIEQEYQDGYVVYTSLTNNDIPLIDRCIELTGKGRATVKQRADATDGRGIVSRFDSYGWRLDGNAAVDVIRAIYPYLIAKRKQAVLAYNLDLSNKRGKELRGNGRLPESEQAKRVLLYDLIKRANQREHVDVPSWCVEPSQEVIPGWWLRSAIVWHKPNPMPESVTDRPTSAYEHIFLLSKQAKYYYDATAIAERSDPAQLAHNQRYAKPYAAYDDRAGDTGQPGNVNNVGIHARPGNGDGTRNARNVWTISTQPFPGSHFAVFPPEIPRRCILAGSREGDTILDPFAGAGTTLLVADRIGRHGIGIEVNPDYVQMAQKRIRNDAPLFAEVETA